MTEKLTLKPDRLFFVTLSVSGYIDIFTRSEYCDIVINSLNHFIEHKHLRIYEYVLMSNQLFMIATSGKTHLSKVLRDFKSNSARQILKSIAENPAESRKDWLMRMFYFFANRYQNNAEHHFWQFGNQPVNLPDEEELTKKKTSLVSIPVKAGLVDDPKHYIYCSVYPQQQVKLAVLD